MATSLATDSRPALDAAAAGNSEDNDDEEEHQHSKSLSIPRPRSSTCSLNQSLPAYLKAAVADSQQQDNKRISHESQQQQQQQQQHEVTAQGNTTVFEAPSPSRPDEHQGSVAGAGAGAGAGAVSFLRFPDHETITSSNYFLSEPSLSPDEDDGESRVRAPHLLPFSGGRAFRRFSSTEEEALPGAAQNYNWHYHYQHPSSHPRWAQASPVPSSPGNTSLSSWDSPSRSRNRVWLQFTPSTFRGGGGGGTATMNSIGGGSGSVPPPHQQHLLYTPGEGRNGRAMLRVRTLEDFSEEANICTPPVTGKHFAEGAAEADARAAAAADGSSMFVPSSPSRQEAQHDGSAKNESDHADANNNSNGGGDHHRAASNHFQRLINGLHDSADATMSDSLVFDTNRTSAGSTLEFDESLLTTAGRQSTTIVTTSPPSTSSRPLRYHSGNGAEESIIMDLSDSDEEPIISTLPLNDSEVSGTDDARSNYRRRLSLGSRTSTFDSNYMQEQTADDEHATTTTTNDNKNIHSQRNQKQKQKPRSLPPPFPAGHYKKHVHMRVRSGDGAAATIAISGGTDWIGMKMDNIPMPDKNDEDDEDGKSTSEEEIQPPPPPKRSPRQQHQQSRPGLTRPPLSGSRAGGSPIPQQTTPHRMPSPPPPPAPWLPPPPPHTSPYSQYQGAGYHRHCHHASISPQYPQPSPAVGPQVSRSSSWGGGEGRWGRFQQDGFVGQNHHLQPDLPPPWFEHQQPFGDSAQLRHRLNSWGTSDFNNIGVDPVTMPSREQLHTYGLSAQQQQQRQAWSVQPGPSDHSSQGSGSQHSGSHQFSARHSDRDEEDSSDSNVSSDDDDEDRDNFDSDEPMTVRENQLLGGANYSLDRMQEIEHKLEDRKFRGTYQNVMRHRSFKEPLGSPFSNIGKKSERGSTRASFFPRTTLAEEDEKKYPTFVCPKCHTRQREFFSVSDAPKLKGPAGYLATYFVLYIMSSLFIFGLEEGWEPLDCVYFAVISLTTAGLGDFVPTTDSNKIICSIFIYFGVACIGLLLGSYIAGIQDKRASSNAKAKQVEACPNCARIKAAQEVAAKRFSERESCSSLRPTTIDENRSQPHVPTPLYHSARVGKPDEDKASHVAVYVPRPHHHHQPRQHPRKDANATDASSRKRWADRSLGDLPENSPPLAPRPPPPSVPLLPPSAPGYLGTPYPTHSQFVSSPQFPSPIVTIRKTYSPNVLGSPMTRQIMSRQSHTRHASFDIGVKFFGENLGGGNNIGASKQRQSNLIPPVIKEETPQAQPPPSDCRSKVPSRSDETIPLPKMQLDQGTDFASTMNVASGEESESSDGEGDSSSVATIDTIVDEKLYKIRAAKYVFMTLQEALGNSLVILAIGCVGFYLIENFTLVDSWYFTVVLLTTTGYGDIVPVTRGGKLFATIYLLVGGTFLLNFMSMIGMIPLELRKRRIERAVLTQFGDSLDDDALRELATGPLIKRLSLHANRSDGLAECTREMFALAMLVRLGKVTENDIRQTFAAFRRLDLNGEGVLNSKSIIAGMIHRRRSMGPVFGIPSRNPQQPPPLSSDSSTRSFFFGNRAAPVHAGIPAMQGDAYYTPPQAAPPNETTLLLHHEHSPILPSVQASSQNILANTPPGHPYYPVPQSPPMQSMQLMQQQMQSTAMGQYQTSYG